MAALLPPAELQFLDADGHPYAGGTLALFTPGTTTPKDSWADADATVLNANPLTLDAAGRCIIYGDGEYRSILSDADGNLIWDQPSNTLVSIAMAPVVIAPTIAEAVRLLGIQDLIDSETTRAENAEAALGQRITDETNRAEAAEANLQSELDAETARAEAAEQHLQDQINALPAATTVQSGSGTTNSGGFGTIAFSPAFPTAVSSVVATPNQPPINVVIRVINVTPSGCGVFVEDTNNHGGVGGIPYYWIAVGH